MNLCMSKPMQEGNGTKKYGNIGSTDSHQFLESKVLYLQGTFNISPQCALYELWSQFCFHFLNHERGLIFGQLFLAFWISQLNFAPQFLHWFKDIKSLRPKRIQRKIVDTWQNGTKSKYSDFVTSFSKANLQGYSGFVYFPSFFSKILC